MALRDHDSGTGGRLDRIARFGKRYRRDVVVAVIGVLVYIVVPRVIGGFGQLVSGVVDHLGPEPSAKDAAIDRLFTPATDSAWLVSPYAPSEEARSILENRWDALGPYRRHAYKPGGAKTVTPTDVVTDRINLGPVVLRGYAREIVDGPADRPDSLVEYFTLSDGSSSVRCISTLARNHRVALGEVVHVVAIPVAWSSRGPLAYAACPAIRLEPAQQKVDGLYIRLEQSTGFWIRPPNMSEVSREFLARHWSAYTPYHRHDYSGKGESTSLDSLLSDQTLDGRLLQVSGYVQQPTVLDRGPYQSLTQEFRLATGSDDAQAYCRITSDLHLQPNDLVSVEAVAIARGAVPLTNGKAQPVSYLVCPSVHRLG